MSIAGEEKGQSRNTVEMLEVIREERRKLREYLDFFQMKFEEGKKTADKKEVQ